MKLTLPVIFTVPQTLPHTSTIGGYVPVSASVGTTITRTTIS